MGYGQDHPVHPLSGSQARFQAQIDLQKLQEYAQRYKPADYKED